MGRVCRLCRCIASAALVAAPMRHIGALTAAGSTPVIPFFHSQGELDELEREEFFRLKKVQKNKQKVAARDLAAKEAAKVGSITTWGGWRGERAWEFICLNN